MAQKKPFFVGNVRISDLNGFEDTQKNGVRGCFIPYGVNPSLFIGQNKQTGGITVDVDILVREVVNSKSGSSHFIKLNVGKANRERLQMSQEAVDSMKIVGNLFTRMPRQAAPAVQQPVYQAPVAPGGFQGQAGYAPVQQYMPQQRGFAPVGDMPDFTSGGSQAAGWE